MAPLALSTPSLPCPLLPAKSSRRAKALWSARHKQHEPLPNVSLWCRSRFPSFKADCERQIQAFSQLFPVQANSVSDSIGVTEFWQQRQKLLATTTLGASLLMVALPANALTDLPSNWFDQLIIALVMAFLYFLVAPVLVYYYLYKRWYKRKMAEAIMQFWLVFLFFPGMLILGPFINLRGLPQEGVKEPWDEMPR